MIDGRRLFTPVCPYTLSISTVRLIIQIIESYEAVVYKKCHILDIAGHCLHLSIVLSSRLGTEYLASAFALTFVLLVSDNTLSKFAEQNKSDVEIRRANAIAIHPIQSQRATEPVV